MAHDEHDNHHVNYLYVFIALCVFTGLSVLFDGLPESVPHGVVIVLVLAVAVAKALSVMMFFMHLKFEGNWKYVLLAPTTILAIGLPLALYPDVGVAYYTPIVPQSDWKSEMDEFKAHHGHSEDGESPGHPAPEGESDGAQDSTADSNADSTADEPGDDSGDESTE